MLARVVGQLREEEESERWSSRSRRTNSCAVCTWRTASPIERARSRSWPTCCFAPRARTGSSAARPISASRRIASLSAKVEKEGGLTVAARQLYEIVKGLPTDEVRVRRTDQNWAEIRSGKVEFKVVGMPDRDYPKLPSIQEAELFERRFGDAARDDRQDDLLGVDRRDPPAPVGRAVRVGRRVGAHGVDRRPPAVEGRARVAGRTEAGRGGADPAQGGHRDPARDRDARGADGDRRVPGELRAQGRRRQPVGQADRRSVSALRPGDPQGQRPRDRGVAARRSSTRSGGWRSCRRTRPRGFASASRRGSCASRATTRISAPPRRRSTWRTRDRRCRSGSTRATSSSCCPRSRPPRCGSSWRASSIPGVVRPADGSDYVGVVMPMRL